MWLQQGSEGMTYCLLTACKMPLKSNPPWISFWLGSKGFYCQGPPSDVPKCDSVHTMAGHCGPVSRMLIAVLVAYFFIYVSSGRVTTLETEHSLQTLLLWTKV